MRPREPTLPRPLTNVHRRQGRTGKVHDVLAVQLGRKQGQAFLRLHSLGLRGRLRRRPRLLELGKSADQLVKGALDLRQLRVARHPAIKRGQHGQGGLAHQHHGVAEAIVQAVLRAASVGSSLRRERVRISPRNAASP